MNISYALYELEAAHSVDVASPIAKRHGALLKICFDSQQIGYADCHPWPELGDLPLTQQLHHLAHKQWTSLTRCAWDLATLDAKARVSGKHLMTSCFPRSHFLIPSLLECSPLHVQQIIQQGYTHVKLKVGCTIEQEIQKIHSLFAQTSLKLRLDFNEKLSFSTFCLFLQRMEKLREKIDFIEDPFPFDVREWQTLQKEGWTLACDRQAQKAAHHPEAAHVVVIKPALQPFEEWHQWQHQTCIVTSYLGHPLGQVAAAYVACQLDPGYHLVHGLLSHHVYRPTIFSQLLNWQNPQWKSPPGTGFGFDQEFTQLEWMTLQ